jgi:2,3-bisphosphoglycerate-independent phosphoglycerate mutase
MLSIEDGSKPFEEKKIISHSAGSIEGDESNTLITDLFNNPAFKEKAEKAGVSIYPGSSFRHIAVQRQGDGSSVLLVKSLARLLLVFNKTDEPSPCLETDEPSPCLLTLTPPHDHLDEPLGQHLPRGNANAAALEELIRLSHNILDNHPINQKRRLEDKLPANCIWFWAEGTAVELPKFTEMYGKTGSVISAVPLCQGIGVLIGLEKIIVEGATGELHTNYEGKVAAAIESLKTRDFTTIHIEAPDECTHNGDLKGKLQAIEWIDSRAVALLLEKLKVNNTDFRMLLMSDHRTLTSTRGHDSGVVPYVLYDSRFDEKTGLKFTEKEAEKGKPVDDAKRIMSLLFEM